MSAPDSRFHVNVHRARGGYFARVIEIPGCVARGATEIEAIENARSAIRAFLLVGQLLAADRPTVRVEISA
jgi:predicted RNase H-like HicB family nuclease